MPDSMLQFMSPKEFASFCELAEAIVDYYYPHMSREGQKKLDKLIDKEGRTNEPSLCFRVIAEDKEAQKINPKLAEVKGGND